MFSVLFTGDTFLKSQSVDNNPFSESIRKVFASSKNVCVNLETTVGVGGIKSPKAYSMQVAPNALRYLTDNNIAICNLANNHSLDYGEVGLDATIKYLDEYYIDHIGTQGANIKELDINGKKVFICSYYGNFTGIARLDQKEIIEDIKHYKQMVDYVIVCLHWGEEYVAFPSPKQQDMARSLVDSGADVIIGHHPHVMQGYEVYNNSQIFYSLGNFNFFVDHPYAKKLIETTKAYCVGVYVEEKLRCEIIPISINANWQPEVIDDEIEKARFFSYFNSISKPLGEDLHNGFWYAKASVHYFHNHLPSWKKRIKEYGVKQFFQMVRWLIHPAIYKFYIGLVRSLFYKKIDY